MNGFGTIHAVKKIVWVSAHDFTSAKICAENGVDAVLVGDSLGNTVYGYDSTRQVTMEMMLCHAEAVLRGVAGAVPIIADMPYNSYRTAQEALLNARRFAEIGITTLKVEGGSEILPQVGVLRGEGFSVVGHLGYLPQSAEKFTVAGMGESAMQIRNDARALVEGGVTTIVLECVEAGLAKEIAVEIGIPIIGIGSGDGVDGQVLVYADIIGRTHPGFRPKFLRRFGDACSGEAFAIQKFTASVRDGEYPCHSERYCG